MWTPKNSYTDYYRDVYVEERRTFGLVRKVHFTKAYVVRYTESASDQEGWMRFSLLLAQKIDCLDEIKINDQPVRMEIQEEKLAEGTPETKLSEQTDKELMKQYDNMANTKPINYMGLRAIGKEIERRGLKVKDYVNWPKMDNKKISSAINAAISLNNDEKYAIAVIAGESIGEKNTKAYAAIACVMANRLGNKEWKRYKNFKELSLGSGFDACSINEGKGNKPFRAAQEYLENRDGSNKEIERIIETAIPYLRKQKNDITNGAEFYYSPQYMNPPGAKPGLITKNKDVFTEYEIDGIDGWAFTFYKYK